VAAMVIVKDVSGGKGWSGVKVTVDPSTQL
jgi:hypothetical protein